jgi:hypothetical protein
MAFELDSKRNVLNSYGVRVTNSAYGGIQEDDVIKFFSVEFQAPSSGAGNAINGLSSAAWAKGGLDGILPLGAIMLSADLVVETAFDALTAITIGTYLASDGTTAVNATGLITAANAPLANLVINGRISGTGALLTTGVVQQTAPTVIRALYTGTVPTVGKARLLVRYMLKAA